MVFWKPDKQFAGFSPEIHKSTFLRKISRHSIREFIRSLLLFNGNCRTPTAPVSVFRAKFMLTMGSSIIEMIFKNIRDLCILIFTKWFRYIYFFAKHWFREFWSERTVAPGWDFEFIWLEDSIYFKLLKSRIFQQLQWFQKSQVKRPVEWN